MSSRKTDAILVPEKYADLPGLLHHNQSQPEPELKRRAQDRVLDLFHDMAQRVPAYRDFLSAHGISPSKIKTLADFQTVPTIDKQNYLRAHSLESLCWDGDFKNRSWVIASTSGSTGTPFYFPREKSQDMQYAGTAELYLRSNFQIHERSTLYIDAFPLGPWIGGIFTYEVIRTIAQKPGYALSIINTGVDKQEIIHAVKKFGQHFDQIIIGCYAPFLKDALDDGVRQGVDWKKYNLRFIFSAEGFSETFRDYVAETAGLKNPHLDTLNHYGTVDQGTLAHETPLSILIRRLALKTPDLYANIFPVRHKLPTLCQYDPELFYFEEVAQGLLCSSYSGLPLVRYDLKDRGGVIGFEEMMARLADFGIDIEKECDEAGIAHTVWKWPFVFVYERSDLSASLYAFLVYPETVRKALQELELRNRVTGKFAMMTRFDQANDQYLEINVELKGGEQAHAGLNENIQQAVTRWLLEENSEFRKTHAELGHRIAPRIVLLPYEDPSYFKPGRKQQWVVRSAS
jgi:phenylacetate-CoA ligase